MLEQAVVREVEEETGLIVMTNGLYSVREVLFKERGEHALISTFTPKIIEGELGISDPDNEILEQLMPYIPEHIILPIGNTINSAYYFFMEKLNDKRAAAWQPFVVNGQFKQM